VTSLFDRAVFVAALGILVLAATTAAVASGAIGQETAALAGTMDFTLLATALTLALIGRAEAKEVRTW